MKSILITGMSGTGKFTPTRELSARGFKSIDLDDAEWSKWIEAEIDGDLSSGSSPVETSRDWI